MSGSERLPDPVYVPLRKKLKRISTGKEDNFVQSYYQESVTVSERVAPEVERLRKYWGIEVDGDDVPHPVTSFEEAGITEALEEQLLACGYLAPTAIQMQSLPCILSGRDLVGLSETGSGKTLAYLIPLLTVARNMELQGIQSVSGEPFALLIVPTRELVEQVCSELEKFVWARNVESAPGLQQGLVLRAYPSVVGVCGGLPIADQVEQLRAGVDVLVATPGRLMDLIGRQSVSLGRVCYLVIDEADRMLEQGSLEEQLRKVFGMATVSTRQTLLWTATFPTAVERLARSAVLNPVYVRIGETGTGCASVTQNVLFTHSYRRKELLLTYLRSTPVPPVLVFCNSSKTVDKLVLLLKKEQFHVAGIHGEKTQPYRFRVMKYLKEGRCDVMVATDVASRGIDVPDCTHVINYDLPTQIETYIHRIGRTGRMGREGTATSFLTLDCKIAKELKSLLERSNQAVPDQLDNSNQFGGDIIRTELGDRPRF